MNLLELTPQGIFVFVGDTHGDLYASEKVIENYLDSNTNIVFLGDYVDRGAQSKENVSYLLEKKKENPERIHLLQGNHERYDVVEIAEGFANFWEGMDGTERKKYFDIFKEFPLAVSVGDIVALHGALPNVRKLNDLNKLRESFKDKNWMATLWGDYRADIVWETYGDLEDFGRPQYGKGDFESRMKQLDKNVLIRSHQPNIPLNMFDGRCITIFTSDAYGGTRNVAIADFDTNKKIESIDDLIIEEI